MPRLYVDFYLLNKVCTVKKKFPIFAMSSFIITVAVNSARHCV